MQLATPARLLRLVLLGLLLVGISLLAGRPAFGSGAPFMIVALPDTQKYVKYDASETRAATFKRQTQWIVDTRATYNTVFVSREGDIVGNGGLYPIEWERADSALDLLDGVLPYSTVIGNHDYDQPGRRSSGTASYLKYFCPARYQGYAWFGRAAADGLNQYQMFKAGDWTFLHLAMELEARDSALRWAQQIINAHPGLPTIVTTHAYQNDSAGRTTTAEFQGNSGEQIWQKLIKPNSQIFMVLNGHFYQNGGEGYLVSYNDLGQAVFQMVANYQDYPNGGDGYLRLLHFQPAEQRIQVRTYSPTLDAYLVDHNSEFAFTLDFNRRFGASTSPSPTPTPTPTSPQIASKTWLPFIVHMLSDAAGGAIGSFKRSN